MHGVQELDKGPVWLVREWWAMGLGGETVEGMGSLGSEVPLKIWGEGHALRVTWAASL